MNLVIDVGNSFVKLAIFNQNKLQHKETVRMDAFVDAISSIASTQPEIKKAVVSSVARLDAEQKETLKKRFELFEINHKTKVPFKNCYKTPKTLGVDRIVLVSASVLKFPNSNVLIVDAGTCVTFDFVTANKEYLGGAISPGIRMRYQSLNHFTVNLPLLDTQMPDNIIGNSTKASMHSGVVNGLVNEIEGVISEYKQKYSDLTVILTGGDANFLSKQLKSSIFANSNFLLEGLNYILQFNSN
ncbi:type III pantothenate kinase [Aestuariivivens sp. NBU2969]|uniref:type III pantothenate kinase n=1 Tax=Aestuariivivens sp. NBU2969 TaxID=2873267 RepID=UPI001CBD7D20|nr:type III pantothenate kinase [Aestuariivivens sp. NBU2969]